MYALEQRALGEAFSESAKRYYKDEYEVSTNTKNNGILMLITAFILESIGGALLWLGQSIAARVRRIGQAIGVSQARAGEEDMANPGVDTELTVQKRAVQTEREEISIVNMRPAQVRHKFNPRRVIRHETTDVKTASLRYRESEEEAVLSQADFRADNSFTSGDDNSSSAGNE